jgi:branched-subunit amino acid aminotransferase/4-amino-4-deoxychorismate lyase
LKHLGTLDLFYFPRLAQKNGFDDVLFVDAEGSISEGSIWNVGFFTGSQVVFPSAPALPGITMHLLQAGLSAQGISWTVQDIQLKDLVSFRSAFLMNSASVGQPIACIDDHTFVVDTTLTGLVMECYETNPWETIG